MNEFETNVYVPVLDDPMTCEEIQAEINRMSPDKACGPDGVPPGIFKWLPIHWVMCLVTLFNVVFFLSFLPQVVESCKAIHNI